MKNAKDVRTVLISRMPASTWDLFGLACKAQGNTIRGTMLDLVNSYLDRPEVRDTIRKRANEYLK